MSTRLERLFLLLESGSTSVVRRSAAEQLGDVQKLHPHEFNNLLSKITTYLSSSSWETRVAAGLAVEAVVKNIPQWNPHVMVKDEHEKALKRGTGLLSYDNFSLSTILQDGQSLLGSVGAEYESEDLPGLEWQEKLAQQKAILNKRLGLDVATNIGLSPGEELFVEDDLAIEKSEDMKLNETKHSVSSLIESQCEGKSSDSSSLSNREKNRAKRRAKLLARSTSYSIERNESDPGSDAESSAKRRRLSRHSNDDDKNSVKSDASSSTFNLDEIDEWPFENFCDIMVMNLFHATWECRHGAAIGLKHIILMHGSGAGKRKNTTISQMVFDNENWLIDLALRLICVLALDRFGDFVSDEVVAPVRESCAQCLGYVLKYLSPENVDHIISILLEMLQQKQWEVRHGGLLAVKYILAVRQDLLDHLLVLVLPSIIDGLQDKDDDVRAVAASALIPVSDSLVEKYPEKVISMVDCLWGTLEDLDDLTASTNSVMTLLSIFLSHPSGNVPRLPPEELMVRTPRLWPFFTHNISSVRKASLDMLNTLILSHAEEDSDCPWLGSLMPDIMRLIFQRVLLEEKKDVSKSALKGWDLLLKYVPMEILKTTAVNWMTIFLCLLMQPMQLPFDAKLLLHPKHKIKLSASKHRHLDSSGDVQRTDAGTVSQQDYIGGRLLQNSPVAERQAKVASTREAVAKMLGCFASSVCDGRDVELVALNAPQLPTSEQDVNSVITNLLLFHLNSKSAVQRSAACFVLKEWGERDQRTCPKVIRVHLKKLLCESIYFDEIAVVFSKMQSESGNLISLLRHHKISLPDVYSPGVIFTMEQVQTLVTTIFDKIKSNLAQRHQASMQGHCDQLASLVQQASTEQSLLTLRVNAAMATAVIYVDCLPDKLNPVIRPLMEAVKLEENIVYQCIAAESLSRLVKKCSRRQPCPNPKVLKNLWTLLCSYNEHTPMVMPNAPHSGNEPANDAFIWTEKAGIISLVKQQRLADQQMRRGAPNKSTSHALDVPNDVLAVNSPEHSQERQLERRGAVETLQRLVKNVGPDLITMLPSLWESMTSSLMQISGDQMTIDGATVLIHSLQLLEDLVPHTDESHLPKILDLIPAVLQCLRSEYTSLRHMASRLLAVLSTQRLSHVINECLEPLLDMMQTGHRISYRQGAVEALSNMVDRLGIKMVPYIVLLVVPIMGRMSDQDPPTRHVASQCFAQLIRLMPLESGIPSPGDIKPSLEEKKNEQRKFLHQLLDSSKLEPYKICVPIKAELRSYQQDGVNWMAFLNRYKLHGVLCDDMGLGKTLQSICILANEHQLQKEQYKKSNIEEHRPLPSLVVCPPTLTGHWVYEIEKFVDKQYLNPLHYTGCPQERCRLQKQFKKHNLVVASYDVVRNDLVFFGDIKWDYCILDEGHLIKNSKTKLSKAVRQLRCNHRLILSGTPIQNNVLELWSLFDFLMPGFLGTERQFQTRYGKPILQSRDAKSSSKEQEAGALAMESLHRQVLPFLLRRLKEDVLKDLPPKIMQDYYCDLSPLQVQLYEDFAKSRAKKSVDSTVYSSPLDNKSQKQKGASHIFQSLQYLRKLCSHPAMVLTNTHPRYEVFTQQLKKEKTNIRDIQHSPKLTALKQLLQDCGIGCTSNPDDSTQPVVNQHRVLLFCQLKTMLDIVENDLLKTHMPGVTHLRLDGSVPPGERYGIVHRFNNDPSIDVLLLTTHVGGLGLNLTGADTIIFVEHDWNPMKDLQAMDRAHRIGQKKVVNVYRLITRGTLEEKIMGLQKFKINIANTVISADNAHLTSMETDQLLDLFTLEEEKTKQVEKSAQSKQGLKSLLENLEDLWDESEYENEYNIEAFMQKLSTE